eukprot:CAMPEP_0119121862 /NCGR_PEP_ID=MMETSP1310-20130426/2294_1 /TAXON_ID=464262 /ORGANISM="Genus nov. species nov., Strain RCC2339" /LENGTH=762 /DNA_ID=CAMNT_0007111443 /DNA_START=151 /DNA_END=2435 /DNA_ORIENTATION=-
MGRAGGKDRSWWMGEVERRADALVNNDMVVSLMLVMGVCLCGAHCSVLLQGGGDGILRSLVLGLYAMHVVVCIVALGGVRDGGRTMVEVANAWQMVFLMAVAVHEGGLEGAGASATNAMAMTAISTAVMCGRAAGLRQAVAYLAVVLMLAASHNVLPVSELPSDAVRGLWVLHGAVAFTGMAAVMMVRKPGEGAHPGGIERESFISCMSHEIRTPLTHVIGLVEILNTLVEDSQNTVSLRLKQCRSMTGRPVNGWAMDALEDVLAERAIAQGVLVRLLESSKVLLKLVNSLLDLDKLDTGSVAITYEDAILRGLLRQILAPFYTVAHAKNIHLEAELPPGDCRVRVDPIRFRQVITNLVSNAIKYTDAGTVRVAAGVALGVIRVSVKDSGVGIPADRQHRLFEPFVQLHSEGPHRRQGGTGLGLCIARKLARLMDGDVYLHSSSEATGSEFRFDLRAQPPAGKDADALHQRPVAVWTEPKVDILNADLLAAQRTSLCAHGSATGALRWTGTGTPLANVLSMDEQGNRIADKIPGKGTATSGSTYCHPVEGGVSGKSAMTSTAAPPRKWGSRHASTMERAFSSPALLRPSAGKPQGLSQIPHLGSGERGGADVCSSGSGPGSRPTAGLAAQGGFASKRGVRAVRAMKAVSSNWTLSPKAEAKGTGRPKGKEALAGMDVLVVDDNQLTCNIAKLMLERAGARCILTFSGKDCLRIVTTEMRKFTFILVDICMPGMSGTELVAAIRNWERTTRPSQQRSVLLQFS